MIYERIKEICAKKKISISSVERATGLSNGSISKWSESTPKVDNLLKIADYLGVTLEELIKDEVKTG